ncbi:hypothetical protein [Nesterenkonia pannonica]|uniref:hypothetical protein n=1 Tax=Nesterenkonia pannonica TaxID=1548602 RepID=UPI0021642553|nr:hypothetical protein [Nesterenkonia pannonica]
MPADDRHAHRGIALLDVVIGVAEASGVPLDPDFVGLWGIEFQLGQLPRLSALVADDSLCSNGFQRLLGKSRRINGGAHEPPSVIIFALGSPGEEMSW